MCSIHPTRAVSLMFALLGFWDVAVMAAVSGMKIGPGHPYFLEKYPSGRLSRTQKGCRRRLLPNLLHHPVREATQLDISQRRYAEILPDGLNHLRPIGTIRTTPSEFGDGSQYHRISITN